MTFLAKDSLGEVSNSPSTIPVWFSNRDEESREKFVTDLAAVSRGKDSATNPDKRYKHLLKEAAPNKIEDIPNGGFPSRPLEFLRVLIYYRVGYYNEKASFELFSEEGKKFATVDEEIFYNVIGRYSYFMGDASDDCKSPTYGLKPILTNMRALITAGIPYEHVPYNKILADKDGKPYVMAIRVKAPMFVFNHLVTHTAFSKEARSERVTSIDPTEYWIPHDFRDRLKEHIEELGDNRVNTIYYKFITYDQNGDKSYTVDDDATIKAILLNVVSQSEAQSIFKDLAYKKELYQRAMLELRFKEWVMVGDRVDPQSWEHLFIERNVIKGYNNWTQLETSIVVDCIKSAYEGQSNINKVESKPAPQVNPSQVDIADYLSHHPSCKHNTEL